MDEATVTVQQQTQSRPRLARPGLLREIISMVLFIVAVYTLLQLALPRSVIFGPSMQPTFYEQQRLIISRLNYLFGQPERGDIIVFNAPDHDRGDPSLIKRVIGIPGDIIEFTDQQLYLNGELVEEPYINEPCRTFQCTDDRWELGPNEYFMMGDNRNHSRDSRRFGPVVREDIVGEALFRYWPLDEIGVVHQHRFSSD
jgi:signal peptidase I